MVEIPPGEAPSSLDCDVLVALHAIKSRASIEAALMRSPAPRLVIGLAGTDVYGGGEGALEALEHADAIVALQPRAADSLPAHLAARVRVIRQSAATRPPALVPPSRPLTFLTVAHLRAVKDPLLPARALDLLPDSSEVRILHVGGTIEGELGSKAAAESSSNQRWEWLGELSSGEVSDLMGEVEGLVIPSRSEGGANVLSEAVASGLPVLATDIPGNAGLLGEDHPGLFEAGSAEGLAALLERYEGEPALGAELRRQTAALAEQLSPEAERAAWAELLRQLDR